MEMCKLFFLIFAIFGSAKASPIGENCPAVTPVSDFDFDKYVGTWYEIQRYENYVQKDGICAQEILGKVENGKTRFSHVMISPKTQERQTQNGTLSKLNGDSSVGLMSIKYEIKPRAYQYAVLATDYDNYSVVWSCTMSGAGGRGKVEMAWVLARKPQISQKLSDEIKKKLENTPVDPQKLENTPQTCNE